MSGLQVNQLLQFALDVNQSCGIVKRCSRCREIKPLENYHVNKQNKDGKNSICKKCKSEQEKIWRQNNRERVCERKKKWKKNNPEKYKESQKKSSVKWAKANKEKINERIRLRKQKNPRFRLSCLISVHIRNSLKGNKKGKHWELLTGYTVGQLKKHLEKQFTKGMSWNNHGKWQIDHIVPISVFNFEKPEDDDFKRCWALSNLRPLWATENLKKSNKLEKHFQPRLIF